MHGYFLVVAASEKRVMDSFRAHGAIRPESAFAFEPAYGDHPAFERLIQSGAVRSTAARLHWLDEARVAERRSARLTLLAIVATMGGMLFVIGWL